jgi:hypothetical protein
MNHRLMLLVLVFVLLAGGLFAQAPPGPVQGPVTILPAIPNPGDSITITYDSSIGTVPAASDTIKLHWGINEIGHGNWHQPPAVIWPANSKGWSDGKAVQSPMAKLPDGTWQIKIATLDTIKTIHFVFTNGTLWDNNGNLDYIIYLGGWPPPPQHNDLVAVTVLVDLGPAVQNRGFTYGDTLEARFGYFGTANELKAVSLKRQGISSKYKGTIAVTTTIGDTLDYSYFAKKNGKDNWEVYYNFEYQGDNQSEAQYRQIPVIKSSITVNDTVRSRSSDPRRPPFFRNKSVIAQNVTVTLACDVRPAYYHLKLGGDPLRGIQGTFSVGNADSVFILGVAVNGPITGSWGNPLGTDWGSHIMTLDNKRMWDDGTHGDVAAGDSIYSITFHFYKDSGDVVGQEFKFGVGGGDNEGGFGNNHVDNIDDSQAESVLEAQFGSIDPYFYAEWDYSKKKVKITGIESAVTRLASSPSLSQNYPNPFNPVTTIAAKRSRCWWTTKNCQPDRTPYSGMARTAGAIRSGRACIWSASMPGDSCRRRKCC